VGQNQEFSKMKATRKVFLIFNLTLISIGLLLSPIGLIAQMLEQSESKHVDLVKIEGVVGPVISEHIKDAIASAQKDGAVCLIIEMDTPGGLDKSMREIIKAIYASEIPIVTYVAPSGSRAASAGCYIAMASQIIAMAPSTSIGAASPVTLGGGGEKEDKTLKQKMMNDAASYMESLAMDHNRNSDWAVEAVTKGASLSEEKALEMNVIEYVAGDVDDLLAQMNGATVKTSSGEVTLETADCTVNEIKMSLRNQFLAVISDPNVAYILLILGFYGLFFELSNPHSIFPGVAGAILLVLGLYALHTLSVNYAGLFLIIFGIILFLAEIKITSHGVLTVGGAISFLLGSVMLFESPVPYLRVSWWVIIPAVVVTTLFFMFAVTLAVRAQRRKPTTGDEGMLGLSGEARTDITVDSGAVFIHGETWQARSLHKIPRGAAVQVVAKDGFVLSVVPFTGEKVPREKKVGFFRRYFLEG
jgi:membrane-bound serine protease (ClpP class)